MKGYTAKPLLFPDVNTLAELFEAMEPWEPTPGKRGPRQPGIGPYCQVTGHPSGHQSLWVRPTSAVREAIKAHMLDLGVGHGFFFKCVIRDDGSCLVTCDYEQILGSRWLALIPATEFDRFGWKADD